MNATQILTREEVQRVLRNLKYGGSPNDRLNLTIFRLACCCGLRRKEICGLNLGDVAIGGPRAAIRVRKEVTKGREGKRRSRLVPLWWDGGTKDDIASWYAYRLTQRQATLTDPLVCRLRGNGGRFIEQEVAKRWGTAIAAALGAERARQLSIHSGRHSFCSHALNAGRSLIEVRDAAGHRNVSTTSIYLHHLEREGVPDVFNFQRDNDHDDC